MNDMFVNVYLLYKYTQVIEVKVYDINHIKSSH